MARATRFLSVLFTLLLGTSALAEVAQSGKPAPNFTAPLSTGGTLRLSQLRGKAVYLNFFATWCPPCNQEAPDVNALQNQYRKRGFVVLGIDERENADKANGYLRKNRLSFKAVVDPSGDVLAPYGAIGLPVHVFINRRGVIKYVRNGEMSKKDMEAAIKSIL